MNRRLPWLAFALLTVCGMAVRGAEPTQTRQAPGAWEIPLPPVEPPPPVREAPSPGIWIDHRQLRELPTSGLAWDRLAADAAATCPEPRLADQNDRANVCVLAKALAYAATDEPRLRIAVVDAIWKLTGNSVPYEGRALALGRELTAYIIAADLIRLADYDVALDDRFRAMLRLLLTTPTMDGPANLIACHEERPNNWGTHCGASRAAIAAYLGDQEELARTAQVFKGYLGDRASYAGFTFGDGSWQCNPALPVGVNPRGCTRSGHSLDGVLPDDQRRGGPFTWPPPQENYAYEGLQGALAQAIILQRAGYDPFEWGDRALLRAFEWLHREAAFPARGDDTWQPHVINHYYGASFPAVVPSRSGKNVGYTDWTHGSRPQFAR